MTDDLRAQVERIKPGDKVTATFVVGEPQGLVTVTAMAYESCGGTALGAYYLGDGSETRKGLGRWLLSIDSHEPALPPEPPVGSVLEKNGRAYARSWDGTWRSVTHYVMFPWSEISDGTVIYTPGGEA